MVVVVLEMQGLMSIKDAESFMLKHGEKALVGVVVWSV